MGSEPRRGAETKDAGVEELDLRGAWTPGRPEAGDWVSRAASASAELDFEGDFVRWVGSASPDGGRAEVSVIDEDGIQVAPSAVVDLHADRPHHDQILFARYNLPPGRHRLSVRAVRPPDAASTAGNASVISVKKFEWGIAMRGVRYVDARPEAHGDDDGPGTTPQRPWRTLARLRGVTLAPACAIRLARGSVWNEQLGPIHGSGRDDAPIVIDAYGQGDRPHIRMGRAPAERAVWLNDPDRLTIRNLEVSGAGAGIVAYYTSNGHRELRFEDIYTHDNDVIHWHDSRRWEPQPDLPGMYHGAAILVTGRVPVTANEAAIEGVTFERILSERDSDPIDICGFNPRSGHLEFLGTALGTHAARGVRIRACDFRNGKGGLNLDNVEDVSIVSSSISGMCSVPQIIGTTGLFFWSVARVTVANSVLSDLPDTGSVDGTGCDLEAYTRQVRFLGSTFARNAASGIEMLAIEVGGRPMRPGDHCVDHEITACGFSDNVRKHRPELPSEQLGSIHLRNDTEVPFSGHASGNLFAERFPLIHVAGNRPLPDWRLEGNIAVLPGELFSAADSFGADSAELAWRYERVDAHHRRDLSWDESGERWSDGDVVIDRFETRIPSKIGIWGSRTWIAPRAGEVVVRGYAVADGSGGRRFAARIRHNGETLITDGDGDAVAVGDLSGVRMTLDRRRVREDDRISFEVSTSKVEDDLAARSLPATWAVSWAPIVAYLPQGTSRA